MCNKENDPNVINAAKFIRGNSDLATKELLNTADLILNTDKNSFKTILDSESIESFQGKEVICFFVFNKIRALKERLIQNPKNAIGWTEIARYYSIIGQNEKS